VSDGASITCSPSSLSAAIAAEDNVSATRTRMRSPITGPGWRFQRDGAIKRGDAARDGAPRARAAGHAPGRGPGLALGAMARLAVRGAALRAGARGCAHVWGPRPSWMRSARAFAAG